MLMLLTGTIGSVLVSLLHSTRKTAAPEAVNVTKERAIAPTEPPPSPSPPQGSAKNGAKQRKGGKK